MYLFKNLVSLFHSNICVVAEFIYRKISSVASNYLVAVEWLVVTNY
jgi:hypothetical protein